MPTLFASAHSFRNFSHSLTILLAFALATPALAQRTIHVPADAPSIQAGINTATNGDTVLVAPGTYLENIDFNGKTITVISSGGPTATIIDGNNKGNTVQFRNQEPPAAVLSGFTIRGGGGLIPGGPYFTAYGAGIVVGAPLSLGSSASPIPTAPSILNNVITNNYCNGISIGGNAAPLIQGNTISNTLPTPAEYGAACSGGSGAGIFIVSTNTQDTTTITNNIIEDNGNDPNGSLGAGIAINHARVVIRNNTIRNNVALISSGAIEMLGSVFLEITGNLIYGNQSKESTVELFAAGQAPLGTFTGLIANNTIFGNTRVAPPQVSSGAPQVSNAQLYLSGTFLRWVIANNIVVGTSNLPAISCADPLYTPLLPIVFDHNDIWNSDSTTNTNGDCVDSPGSFGNLSTDPLFANAIQNDFHLRSGSPAIDSGNSSVDLALPTDLEGTARPSDGTGKGYAVVDMGALEFQGTPTSAQTRLLITPDQIRVNSGSTILLTVNINSPLGVPTGTVNFTLDGVALGSATVPGTTTFQFRTPALGGGLHALDATYDGQGVFSPAVAVKTYVLVDGPASNLTLVSSANPATLHTPVIFTATLPPSTIQDGGFILFSEAGATLATVPVLSGSAAFTTATLSRGNHLITATNSGNPATAASLNQVIQGLTSSTTLTASATTVIINTPITLTATTITQSGVVPNLSKLQIFDGTTPLAPLTISANSLTVITVLTPGTHTLTAVFSGDANAEPSTSSTVTVNVAYPTATSISFTPPTGIAFQDLLANALVSTPNSGPPPTGSITFHTASAILGTASLVNGTASIKLNLPAGNYAITGNYAPANAAFLQSSVTATLLIDRAPVMLSLAPTFTSLIPQSTPASFTFRFSDGTGRGLATGSLFFLVDGKPTSQTTPLALLGSTAVSNLPPGSHTVALAYSGDPNFLPTVTAAVQFTVLQRDFAITGNQTISIPAGRYRGMPLNLASIGDFTGQVGLACADLPLHASCRFTQAPVGLSAGGTASTTLVVDTSALPGYESAANRSTRPANNRGIFAAALSPLALLSLLLMRRRRPRYPALYLCVRLSAALLLTVAAAQLSGCSGLYPASTPPGTYTIHILGKSGNIAHTHTLTLTVTPQNGQ